MPTTIKNASSACKKWTRLACARVSCFPFFAFTLHLHPLHLDLQLIVGEGKDRFCLHPLRLTFPHSMRTGNTERKCGKGVDFDQKRAYLRAKTHNNPSAPRTAVKTKVNTNLHLFLYRINLIYCVLHKQVKGEGKKRKIAVCARALAREEMHISTSPDSLFEKCTGIIATLRVSTNSAPHFSCHEQAELFFSATPRAGCRERGKGS